MRSLALTCALLVPLPASAEVLSASGDVVHSVPANPDLSAGNNRSPQGYAFLEYPSFGVDVTMPGGTRFYGELPVGRWGRGATPTPDAGIAVSPTDLFASHLIHIDNADEGPRRYRGEVVFDAEIVAIFVSDSWLQATDLATDFGYSDDMGRGTEVFINDAVGDIVERGSDGLTVKFDVGVTGEDRVDQIRVITRVDRPVAQVELLCPIEVTVEGTTLALSSTVRNAIPMTRVEPSLPVELRARWLPSLGAPPTGDIRLDGAVLSCGGTPGVETRCSMGRVAPGDHALEGTAGLEPGTAATLVVELVGPDVVSAPCEVTVRIPNVGPDGSVVDVDAGVPPGPPPQVATFGGGGGARCAASPGDRPSGTLLFVLSILLGIVAWRRR